MFRIPTTIMVETYFTDREPEEQKTYQELFFEVRNNIPDELLSFLPSMSFIMFKPDAYLRGLVPQMLRLFAENGIYPVKYRLKQLEATDIDRLYMFVKPKYIESWWIMEKTYRLAPCCPVIVIGKPEGYPHLSARIRDLVGPTTPKLGTNTNIRYRFRGAHRIFNLIHGTDDPAAAVREALVFFTLDDVKRALKGASDTQEIGSKINIPEQELTPPEIANLDFHRAKHTVKRALIDRLKMELESTRGQSKPLDQLKSLSLRFDNLLEQEHSIIQNTDDPKARRVAMRNVSYLQLRTCSLARDYCRQVTNEISRNAFLELDVREKLLSTLPPMTKCIEIARALTTSVEFKECHLDEHFAWLKFLRIPVAVLDEANLHAAWSVVSTEFVDLELKYPEAS